MARRSPVRRGLPSVVVAVLVVALTVAVGGLVALALQRGQGAPVADRTADPVPAATPSPSPSPSASPTAITAPGTAERFLVVGDDVIWRATAGSCGTTAPVVERSDDNGATWDDVTPTYRDIAQVRALTPLADTQATAIADVGDGCETQALQTFTDGAFWSPYEKVLVRSTYLADGTVVIDGTALTAPCAEPWGLRTSGDAAVFVCDGTAYETTGGQTSRIGDGVVALDIHDGEIVAASVAPECDGLQLTALSGDRQEIACVDADAAAPTALTLTDDAIWLWNGDALTSTPR